ncbi:MFS general substrate transporter [Aspergillus stella-maris]|uniref:MFS general substrate transporter n=1 Tax=Aspergillus stella-maris TaxID=1810926 RepID=UPI003CCCE344
MAHSTTERLRGYAWRSSRIFIVAVISMAMFTDQFLFSFIIPILPVILRDRLQVNSSHTQFLTSVVLSLNALVSIAVAPFTGYLADRVKWKNGLMLWSCAVNVVGTALTAWSRSLAILIIGRLLQTLAGSMIWIAGMAILGNSVGSERLASTFSLCTLFVSAGALSGPAISGALFEVASYSATWSSAFVVIVVGAILQGLLIEPSALHPSERRSPRDDDTASDTLNESTDFYEASDTDSLLPSPGTPRSPASSSIAIYWQMLRIRRVATALTADALFAVIIASFEATIPLHVREVFGWESLQSGLMFLLLQAPALILVIPAGWLKDRIGMHMPATVGFLLMGPCLWLLGVPGHMSFEWATDRQAGEAIYITTLVGIGICRTLILGFGGVEVMRGANKLSAEIPGIFGASDGYSRAFAMSNISWKLGMFLGPLLSGLLTESVGYYMMNVVLESHNPLTWFQHLSMSEREVIVLAGGTGDLGRYLQEELTRDGRYAVALLTRKAKRPSTNQSITVHETDYTESSVLSILDSTRATALISVIRADDIYLPLHISLLNACLKSATCSRFLPSEWAGNIEDYPNLPRPYGETRGPLREILYRLPKEKLTWTLFNFGWFMDYFLSEEKSYMKCLPGEFPIDPVTGTYCVRGTGEELQSWTYRPFKRVYRSLAQIAASIEDYKSGVQTHTGFVAEIEEWTVSGATACPKERTIEQHERFFAGMQFLTVEDMLRKAEVDGRV